MPVEIHPGDCVKIPDGRVGRVREEAQGLYCVRVRRLTSTSHHFLWFTRDALDRVDCPRGWMSPEGYNRYLAATIAKMRLRLATQSRAG